MQAIHCQLGEIATIFVGMPTKQSQLWDFGPSGNILTVRAVGEFGIDCDGLVRVDLNGRDIARYQAKADDLVLSARSTTLKMGIVPDELNGVIINATLVAIRSMPALDPRLLAAYLSHPDGQAVLDAVAQSATIQMNLTVNALRELEVPVPSAVDQKWIVDLLTTADLAFESAVHASQLRRRLANEVVANQLKESSTP